MKHTLKLAAIAIVMTCFGANSFAQQNVTVDDAARYGNSPYSGQSLLTLVNNTDAVVFASFVYFDPIDQCWVSRGWRTIKPHGTNTIDFGVYSGNVFIHGYQPEGKLNWGSGYTFCCEAKAPFRVLHANGNGCEMQRNYTQVPISTGNNRYEFNY